MSFPELSDINLNVNLPTDKIANLLLASIAFEELGLAHIINAEAEKIQSVLGTLTGQSPSVRNPSIDDLERIDKAVQRIMRDVIKKEMLLQFKLEDVLTLFTPTDTAKPTEPG